MSLYLVNILLVVGILVVLVLALWVVRRWRARSLRSASDAVRKELERVLASLEASLGQQQRSNRHAAQALMKEAKDLTNAAKVAEERLDKIENLDERRTVELQIDRLLSESTQKLDQIRNLLSYSNRFEPTKQPEWKSAQETTQFKYKIRAARVQKAFWFINIVTTLIALVPLGIAVYNVVINNQEQALNFNLAAIATLIVTKGGLFLLAWILLPAAKAIPGAVTGAIIKGVYDDRRKRRKKASD